MHLIICMCLAVMAFYGVGLIIMVSYELITTDWSEESPTPVIITASILGAIFGYGHYCMRDYPVVKWRDL